MSGVPLLGAPQRAQNQNSRSVSRQRFPLKACARRVHDAI